MPLTTIVTTTQVQDFTSLITSETSENNVVGTSFPTAAVVGGVLGVILCIVIIVSAMMYLHMKQKLKSGKEHNNAVNSVDKETRTVCQQPNIKTYQGLMVEEGAYENDNQAFDDQNIHHEYDEIKDNNYYNLPGGKNETNPYEDVNAYENTVLHN